MCNECQRVGEVERVISVDGREVSVCVPVYAPHIEEDAHELTCRPQGQHRNGGRRLPAKGLWRPGLDIYDNVRTV